MNSPLRKNIWASLLEKFGVTLLQFLTMILMTRNLPRTSFGIVGAVAGAFAFIQLINISIENVVLRDHAHFSNDKNYLRPFYAISFVRSGILLLLSILISIVWYFCSSDLNILYVIASNTMILILDVLIGVDLLYLSAKYKHFVVTQINLTRFLFAFFLSLPLLFYPDLRVLLVRDIMILIMIYCLTKYLVKKNLGISMRFKSLFTLNDLDVVKRALLDYSLWTHLTGAVTNIVYKADAFILSLYASSKDVGDYSVALSGANVASVIPMVLAGQESVALSHQKEKEKQLEIVGKFFRLSLIVNIVTYLCFVFLGRTYLSLLITDSDLERQYLLLLYIVGGLVLVKSVTGPLVSLVNMKGSVKSFFFKVSLPLLLITLFLYFSAAAAGGAILLAVANIVNASIWSILIYLEAKKMGVTFCGLFDFRSDLVRWCKRREHVH